MEFFKNCKFLFPFLFIITCVIYVCEFVCSWLSLPNTTKWGFEMWLFRVVFLFVVVISILFIKKEILVTRKKELELLLKGTNIRLVNNEIEKEELLSLRENYLRELYSD